MTSVGSGTKNPDRNAGKHAALYQTDSYKPCPLVPCSIIEDTYLLTTDRRKKGGRTVVKGLRSQERITS